MSLFLIIGYSIAVFYILYRAFKRNKEPRIVASTIYYLFLTGITGYIMGLYLKETKYLFIGISALLLVSYIIYITIMKKKK
jgi:Na+-driven multidrug efflux pump